MKYLILFAILLPSIVFSQLELKTKQGYCIDSNYLYLKYDKFQYKNWNKIEWFNNSILLKTISNQSKLEIGVTTNIGSSDSSFYYPEFMFMDSIGTIYVVDYGNLRVQKWLKGAKSGITVAGGNGRGSAPNQFNEPQGIYVDNGGNIYVADRFNNRIQKFTPGSTNGITVAITKAPFSVFVDKKGNVYADDNGISVKKFNSNDINGKIVAGGNGIGSNSNQLNYIFYIYVDDNDTIYVSDNTNHRIQKWSPNSTTGITIAGGNGSGSSSNQLHYPFGFYFDKNKNLYIADSWNQRIQKWEPGAKNGITVAGGNGKGALSNQFNFPQSIFVDKSLTYYILDRNNCRIQKWDENSLFGVTIAGSANGTGEFFNSLKDPLSIIKKNDGNLLIVDKGNNRIQEYNTTTSISSTFTNVTWPNDVKEDKYGNIFVSAESCHCVYKYTKNSKIGVIVAGGNGNGSAANQFYNPMGIFIDKNDNLYVADINNQRIQKFSPGSTNGITVAGGNGVGQSLNQLNKPSSVFVDENLNLFVVDQYNHRIQKWEYGANTGITVAGGNGRGSNNNQLAIPYGIYLDSKKNMYISDTYNWRIVKWPVDSNSGVTILGENKIGSSLNQLNYPSGIYLDSTNKLWIADMSNNRILSFKSTNLNDTIFYPTSIGIYKAIVHDENGSKYVSNEIGINQNLCLLTNLEFLNNNNYLSFSPNPFLNHIFINFKIDGVSKLDLEVFDMNTGNKVYWEENIINSSKINFNNLPQGFYIFKLTSKNKKILYNLKGIKIN